MNICIHVCKLAWTVVGSHNLSMAAWGEIVSLSRSPLERERSSWQPTCPNQFYYRDDLMDRPRAMAVSRIWPRLMCRVRKVAWMVVRSHNLSMAAWGEVDSPSRSPIPRSKISAHPKPAVERMWHTQGSQGQILTLAFRQVFLETLLVVPFLFGSGCANTQTTGVPRS